MDTKGVYCQEVICTIKILVYYVHHQNSHSTAGVSLELVGDERRTGTCTRGRRCTRGHRPLSWTSNSSAELPILSIELNVSSSESEGVLRTSMVWWTRSLHHSLPRTLQTLALMYSTTSTIPVHTM